MAIKDFRTGDISDADYRTSGFGADAAGSSVVVTPDPVVFVIAVLDPTVTVTGPITVTPDPVVFAISVLNPRVSFTGSGRKGGLIPALHAGCI